MADLAPPEHRLTLHRSQSFIEKTESSTSCNSYGADPISRTLRAVELSIASDARDDLRDHWKILPHRHAVQEGRKLFIAGIPKMDDDSDAVLQISRIFLHEGFDLKHIKLLRGADRGQSSPNADDEFHYAFVDLMRADDAINAVSRLDGAVRLDSELLVSIAALDDELIVGPLPGYQPRRKQVTEVRKLFKNYKIGEVSLFYGLDQDAPEPGEELFVSSPKPNLYFCAIRLIDVEHLDSVVQGLNGTIWSGRQIFLRRPKPSEDAPSQGSLSSLD